MQEGLRPQALRLCEAGLLEDTHTPHQTGNTSPKKSTRMSPGQFLSGCSGQTAQGKIAYQNTLVPGQALQAQCFKQRKREKKKLRCLLHPSVRERSFIIVHSLNVSKCLGQAQELHPGWLSQQAATWCLSSEQRQVWGHDPVFGCAVWG